MSDAKGGSAKGRKGDGGDGRESNNRDGHDRKSNDRNSEDRKEEGSKRSERKSRDSDHSDNERVYETRSGKLIRVKDDSPESSYKSGNYRLLPPKTHDLSKEFVGRGGIPRRKNQAIPPGRDAPWIQRRDNMRFWGCALDPEPSPPPESEIEPNVTVGTSSKLVVLEVKRKSSGDKRGEGDESSTGGRSSSRSSSDRASSSRRSSGRMSSNKGLSTRRTVSSKASSHHTRKSSAGPYMSGALESSKTDAERRSGARPGSSRSITSKPSEGQKTSRTVSETKSTSITEGAGSSRGSKQDEVDRSNWEKRRLERRDSTPYYRRQLKQPTPQSSTAARNPKKIEYHSSKLSRDSHRDASKRLADMSLAEQDEKHNGSASGEEGAGEPEESEQYECKGKGPAKG